MAEKNIIEKNLLSKIESLMDYRLFPVLINESAESEVIKNTLFKNLIDLQAAIYHLDAHLETNWVTNESELINLWEDIYFSLMNCGISSDRKNEYLNHIRKYEKHEIELRHGKSPLRFDMEYFYFYKSCDVKLLRRLIYERLGLGGLGTTLAEWRYYDLITEVNDDIEDLVEDLDFINGNRFLISLIEQGREQTELEFLNFMIKIGIKAKSRYQTSKGKFSKQIYDTTVLRINETQTLMRNVLMEVDDGLLYKSRLYRQQKTIQI